MEYTGGCQCGRVRYRAEGPSDHASVCYCRMCQKASGQPLMAFVRFPETRVTWTTPPEVFASSSLVERGFCASCGTPLTYRYLGTGRISVALNSLDDPSQFEPQMSFFGRERPDWLDQLANLPDEEGDVTGEPGFVNHQR